MFANLILFIHVVDPVIMARLSTLSLINYQQTINHLLENIVRRYFHFRWRMIT